MTNLSVNINKVATLRNARGENRPCVEDVACDCESFGADGITVHPRPDERHIDFLTGIVDTFKEAGIRTSIFVDPDPEMIAAAAKVGTDRVELYTKPYADAYRTDPAKAVAPYAAASDAAHRLGLGVNAGHDLDLDNLAYFRRNVPYLNEVSIGHALICDALYLGLAETIKRYKTALR